MAKPYKQEKKAYKKAKRKYIGLWNTVALICAILTVIMIPVNVVLGMFDNTISLLVAGNRFWERMGFTAREDLTYRNCALRELVRRDT